MRAPTSLSPVVSVDDAVFALPHDGYRRVALVHELRRPRVVPFARRGRWWKLRLRRPPVDRVEYLLQLDRGGGLVEQVPDPANPLRARGVFGDKSVVEFPEYEPPAWVGDEESPAGELRPLRLPSRTLRTAVDASLWSPVDTDPREPLPLLLVHDGPDYAHYSELRRLLDHLVAFGEVPPLRAALLPPPLDRGETYSASARYARALVEEWLPALRDAAPMAGRPVGLGASLGAVALLHAHWARPGGFGALLLQSGSFFRPRFDSHEARFARFPRVTRFASAVVAGRSEPDRIPLTFTCGAGEENLDNNREVSAALAGRGWNVRLVEHRDAHNWVGWRDALHPHLAHLLL